MTDQKKKKARLLLTVWGQKYFDYLTCYALPSWLAPNNLPALATRVDLEIDILTLRNDGEVFSASTSCAALREICPVNFIDIDDLVGKDMYSVTLTGAFGRGIIRHGTAMTEIAFIFMNADFILSDESLSHLGDLIARGETAIMAPSYRAVEEAVAPVLTNWIDTHDGKLDMPPRDIVGLALDRPHPTTIAKFATQQGVVSLRPNQLYWRVDDQTVVGRYLLTFMLCIKPHRVVHHINSYCDYSFIQHFASLDDLHTITDSDNLFMLELQSHDFERELLRPGHTDAAYVARTSAPWATALHIKNFKQTLLFHSRDLPDDIAETTKAAERFVDQAIGMMPPARNHIGHPHWIGGLTNWRERSGVTSMPEEFDHPDNRDAIAPPSTYGRRIFNAARRFNAQLNANMPTVPFWHFHYANYRRIAAEISAYGKAGSFVLVSDARSVTPGMKQLAGQGLVLIAPADLEHGNMPTHIADHRHVVILLHPDQLPDAGRLQERLRSHMPLLQDSVLFSPLYLGAIPQASVPVSSLMKQIDTLIPPKARHAETILVGRALHIFAHELTIKFMPLIDARPRFAAVVAIALIPVVTVLGVIGSCVDFVRGQTNHKPDYVAGLFIKVKY
ncbi:MAG: hypothetical protein Q7S99_13155 [Parvibaculum sp.]|nr:hypothetical protein [Parvibaculum sp.]|tara:strand:- start:36358 stop:38208 length:1851 start_codon:yes stop_codon:yes gene_type:complete